MKNFETLISDLSTDDLWLQYGPELALLEPGQWDHLVTWGAAKGYAFTVDDVKAYFQARASAPSTANSAPVATAAPAGRQAMVENARVRSVAAVNIDKAAPAPANLQESPIQNLPQLGLWNPVHLHH